MNTRSSSIKLVESASGHSMLLNLDIIIMESELEMYGKFVVYNGMKRSCEFSKKPSEFLLRAVYTVIDKQTTSLFFLKGIRDYLQVLTEDQLLESAKITPEFIYKAKQAHDWVIEQENRTFFQNSYKLMQKKTKFDNIDKYKNLEISKSIIFKHLKHII